MKRDLLSVPELWDLLMDEVIDYSLFFIPWLVTNNDMSLFLDFHSFHFPLSLCSTINATVSMVIFYRDNLSLAVTMRFTSFTVTGLLDFIIYLFHFFHHSCCLFFSSFHSSLLSISSSLGSSFIFL